MLTEPEVGSPEFWAALRPDAPAVISGERVLTYRQWNEAADAVAEGLSAAGLRQGDRLGMRFRLGPEWFIVQRALQKLGVAQVAVNWRLTPEEAMYILRDSGAKGLACNDVDVRGWADRDLGVLVTVGQTCCTAGLRYEDLLTTPVQAPRFGPARAQLVLYTSGTTGRPRGVPPVNLSEISDLNRLLRYVTSVDSIPPYPDSPTTLLTLPVHHGAGPAAAQGTCAKGGTVVTLDPYDPEEALRLISMHGVQSWTAVPTMLLRIQKLPDHVLGRYDLASLTTLSTGAAPVPQSLKEWIVERLGEHLLWEAYGASEVGMISYAAPEHQLSRPGTSGKPYDGVELAIVDASWNRLGPNQVGEIAVNTPIVLRNYLGADPLSEDIIKDGFYRTGDVGYLDADGYLFITDRIKDMIVAGGTNIYPAEIEKALASHENVVEAAVIGVPDNDFGEKPLAFVIPAAGHRLDESDLLDHLADKIAAYKKPRQFVFVNELPRNPMGKVLKNELREPYWEGCARRV